MFDLLDYYHTCDTSTCVFCKNRPICGIRISIELTIDEYYSLFTIHYAEGEI